MSTMTIDLQRPVVRGAARAHSTAAQRLQCARRRRTLAVLLAVVFVLLVAWQAAGVGGEGVAAQEVVVAEGQTLSHLASEYLPGLAPAEGVLRIQEANDLGTTAVEAGQVLEIPAG